MYTIYIYNNDSRRLERYRLESYHNMPYTRYSSMTVSDFFSNTVSSIGWTSTDFLHKWSDMSRGNIYPQAAFRRIAEGGHTAESMHYAGLAADTSQFCHDHNFPFQEGNHVALSSAGYPEVNQGDIGLFVLVLQDALASLGFKEGELDGFFGRETKKALSCFCNSFGLPESNGCNHDLWKLLAFQAAGCGITDCCKHINRRKIIL